jgi:TonB dependent receptor.
MYVADKIVSTDADVAQVQEMLDKNPKAFAALGAVPQKGDILFKDMNNDGVIDPTDRDNVGSSMPKHMFGLTLTADYKGIDFSVFMQGVTGIDGYLNEKYFTTNVQRGYQLSKEIIDNRWTADNLDAKYPRLTSQTAINSQANTVWLQSKDYLKIRNIQLGYTFPKALFRRVDLQKLRVYGSLENFFTFTKYKGIDPELDNLGYPTMRQAVVGVSVEF